MLQVNLVNSRDENALGLLFVNSMLRNKRQERDFEGSSYGLLQKLNTMQNFYIEIRAVKAIN